jgi:hypothetical protein
MTKRQCIDANTKAQELRREGKLSAAREQLRTCADASCPAMVRDDCVKRLDELERAQPSVVFDVKDTRGGDVIDVRVSVDGQVLADHLDGSPLRIDPGVHVFAFEVAGQPPVTERLLIREGEIGRHEPVVVAIGPSSSTPPPPSSEVPPASSLASPSSAPAESDGSSPAGGWGRQRVLGLVLGGAGVAGLAVGTTFGILGNSAWNRAKSACGGNTTACTNVPSGESYRSTAEGNATISTVGFIAGGVLLATGAVLFVTATHPKKSTTAFVAPSVGPRQAALVVTGAFQ